MLELMILSTPEGGTDTTVEDNVTIDTRKVGQSNFLILPTPEMVG